MLQVRLLDSIEGIDRAQWNAIAGTDYPFTRHEFLHALEASGATTPDRGWQPRHALVERQGQPVAVMPLYEKQHSFGEYVFDWAWASAYERHGLPYYPKWLAAIPFTPATGPRLCVAPGEDTAAIAAMLLPQLCRRAGQQGASSLHVLFPTAAQCELFTQAGLQLRLGAQYHWLNRGYNDFEAFLSSFNARKRKSLKRERRRVTEQGLSLEVLEGGQISAAIWQRFYRFYQLTYAKRSGHGGYLGLDFFQRIGTTLPENLVLVLAREGERIVAGALNFRDSTTLYGRYWGCENEFDALHFEACYYQGIDYCIRNGLQRFDPGAQGEHKIQRGFEPVTTRSCHWLAHPGFSEAVGDFLQRERAAVEDYLEEARGMLPFRQQE